MTRYQTPTLALQWPGVDGLYFLNQHPVGEVTRTAPEICTPISPLGPHYVAFFPLDNQHSQCQALPVMRKLELKGGEPVRCESLSSRIWRQGVWQVCLKPPMLYPEYTPLPQVRCQIEFQPHGCDPHAAMILDDGFPRLILEKTGRQAQLLLEQLLPELVGENESPVYELQTIRRENATLLLCWQRGTFNTSLFILSVNQTEIREVFSICGRRVELTENEGMVEVLTDPGDICGHGLKSRYSLDGLYTEMDQEVLFLDGSPRAPLGREETVSAFLQAVQLNLTDEALSFISSDLRQVVSTTELRTFFGSFDDICPAQYLPAGERVALALLYGQEPWQEAQCFFFSLVGHPTLPGQFLIDDIQTYPTAD